MDKTMRLSRRFMRLCIFAFLMMIMLLMSGMASEFSWIGTMLRLSGVVPVICFFSLCVHAMLSGIVPATPKMGIKKAIAVYFGILLVPMGLNVYLAFSAHRAWGYRMSFALWALGVLAFCLGGSPKKETPKPTFTVRKDLR